MASAAYAAAGPESVITVKISYDGCTRRAKMVLRDMVPGQLEQQVRTFLRVPSEQPLVIERYSDSAGSYVVLENHSTAVYKQLYRAAKAKYKLKLRVTNPNAVDDKPAPRPVTVEDVPDASSTTAEVDKDTQDSVTVKSEDAHSFQTTPLATQQSATGAPSEMTLPVRSAPHAKPKSESFGEPLSKAAQQLAEFENMRKDLTERLNNMADLVSQPTPGCSEAAARRMRFLQSAHKARMETYKRVPESASDKASTPSCAAVRNQISIGNASGLRNNHAAFAVCCNSCDKTMPDVHYHCSTCDDGDFDLCSSCVDLGITCHSPSHWMIKRTTVNGQIVNSTTEVLPPKPKKVVSTPVKVEPEEQKPKAIEVSKPTTSCFSPPLAPVCYDTSSTNGYQALFNQPFPAMRTCNNCIATCPESDFLHCTKCDDFDLCQSCFTKNQHGHHPSHGFTTAVPGTEMPDHIKVKMAPGRNQMHHAICDGCDKFISGVRHKCLDCPDWDYCATCHPNAHFVHPGHRFVPIYGPLAECPQTILRERATHQGICCDGPLCANDKGYPSYIRGIRYKCVVCDDVDFCANCEANPNTNHNKTHPLIKIKSPIRHINVTTTGESGDGTPMRPMGDHHSSRRSPISAKTLPSPKTPETKAASHKVQTEKITPTTDVKPASSTEDLSTPSKLTVEVPTPRTEPKAEVTPEPKEKDLNAVFVRDTVVDGTIMSPNHVFEQSWVLRNESPVAWPAGCSVKYVGGDYMGHVDSNHPAEISKLVSASESVVCYDSLAPGQEFAFTVLLRTPSRPGKFVSYWRLSTPEGLKFGHRLWCDVVVRAVKVEEPRPVVETSPIVETTSAQRSTEENSVVEEADENSVASSRMIFPKLEKESPAASMHEQIRAPSTVAPSTIADDKVSSTGVPDESAEDEDWDVSEDGFMTDEEYDILDASDEELFEEHARKARK